MSDLSKEELRERIERLIALDTALRAEETYGDVDLTRHIMKARRQLLYAIDGMRADIRWIDKEAREASDG